MEKERCSLSNAFRFAHTHTHTSDMSDIGLTLFVLVSVRVRICVHLNTIPLTLAPYVHFGNPELYDPTDTCRPTNGQQSGD